MQTFANKNHLDESYRLSLSTFAIMKWRLERYPVLRYITYIAAQSMRLAATVH